jgi:hypothetical protein
MHRLRRHCRRRRRVVITSRQSSSLPSLFCAIGSPTISLTLKQTDGAQREDVFYCIFICECYILIPTHHHGEERDHNSKEEDDSIQSVTTHPPKRLRPSTKAQESVQCPIITILKLLKCME